MAATHKWFYIDTNRDNQGPFTAAQLSALWKQGNLHDGTLVFAKGLTDTWTKIAEIPELRQLMESDVQDSDDPTLELSFDVDEDETAKVPIVTHHKKKLHKMSRGELHTHMQKNIPYLNRLVLCFFAVALLWCTSLSVAMGIVKMFIFVPDINATFTSCESLYNETLAEQAMFESCVDRQEDNSFQLYHLALKREMERSGEAEQYNEDLVRSALEGQSECSAAQLLLLQVLQNEQTKGATLTFHNQTMCPPEDKEKLVNLVGDVAAIMKRQNAIVGLSLEYKSNTSGYMAELARAYKARRDYDDNYMASKLEELAEMPAALDGLGEIYLAELPDLEVTLDTSTLLECVSMNSTGDDKCPTKGLVEAYNDAKEEFEASMADVREDFEDNLERAQRYKEDAELQLDGVLVFLDKIRSIRNDVSGYFNAIGIDIDTGMPVVYKPSLDLQPLPDIPSMPEAPDLAAPLEPYARQYKEDIKQAGQDSKQVLVEYAGSVQETVQDVPTMLDDYDPPEADTNKVIDKFDAASKHFIEAEEQAVEDLNNGLGQAKEVAGGVKSSFNASDVDASQANLNFMSPFAMSPMVGRSLDIGWIELTLDNMTMMLLVIDWIFRGARSFRMLYRFWTRASVAISPVNLTGDSMSNSKFSPRRCLAELLISPLIPFVLAVAVGSGVVVYGAQLYSPVYEEYVDGCVRQETNGTFVTENLNALVFNIASKTGNEGMLSALDRYNTQKTHNCTQFAEPSAETEGQIRLDMKRAQELFVEAAHDVRLVKRCIDTDRFDEKIRGLDGAEDRELLLLGTILRRSASSCFANWERTRVLPSAFNCSRLPECKFSCTGPNVEVIQHYASICGCNTEWLVHSSFMKFSLSILVFICLNVSRSFLVSGFGAMLWRSFSSGEFRFVDACEEDGTSLHDKDKLKRVLNKKLQVQSIKGLGMVLVGVAITVPWSVFLAYVAKTLEYTGHTYTPSLVGDLLGE